MPAVVAQPKAWGASASSTANPNATSSPQPSDEGEQIITISPGNPTSGEKDGANSNSKMPSPTETLASTAAGSSIAFQSPAPNTNASSSTAGMTSGRKSGNNNIVNTASSGPGSKSVKLKLKSGAAGNNHNGFKSGATLTGASIGTAGVPASVREDMLRMTPQSMAPASVSPIPFPKSMGMKLEASEAASSNENLNATAPTALPQPTVVADPTKVIKVKPMMPYKPEVEGAAGAKKQKANNA